MVGTVPIYETACKVAIEKKDIFNFTKHYGKVKAKDIMKQLIKI